MDTTTLGRLVYEKRQLEFRKMMGLREAANQSGVSISTLSRVERGGPVSLESFRKICAWLRVSADSLLELPTREEPDGSDC